MRDTLELLWFFLLRTVLLGLFLGVLLGAVYGGVSFALLPWLATLQNDGLEQGGDTLLVPPVGALLGAVLGGFLGLVLGALEGLLVGTLTRIFFYPPPADGRRYVRTAACVAASVPALPATVMILPAIRLFTLPDEAFPGVGQPGMNLLLFEILPLLVASCAVWWVCRKVSVWYLIRYYQP